MGETPEGKLRQQTQAVDDRWKAAPGNGSAQVTGGPGRCQIATWDFPSTPVTGSGEGLFAPSLSHTAPSTDAHFHAPQGQKTQADSRENTHSLKRKTHFSSEHGSPANKVFCSLQSEARSICERERRNLPGTFFKRR